VENNFTGEYVWTRVNNQFGWQSLRGDYDAQDERKGWFSPSLAENLQALPACCIFTGALDLFLDENLEYGRRLIDAGVPVEMHVYPGAVHGFNSIDNSPLRKQYDQDLHRALSRFWSEA
jgi:acetyl esterase/lipase